MININVKIKIGGIYVLHIGGDFVVTGKIDVIAIMDWKLYYLIESNS